jgi:hypothetical protein
MFEIACSFPALKRKGVKEGRIPGIQPDDFHDGKLSEYLHNGPGCALSNGEAMILEFLLNLFAPYVHDKFNLGDALKTLDPDHMNACLKGMVRMYNGT